MAEAFSTCSVSGQGLRQCRFEVICRLPLAVTNRCCTDKFGLASNSLHMVAKPSISAWRTGVGQIAATPPA